MNAGVVSRNIQRKPSALQHNGTACSNDSDQRGQHQKSLSPSQVIIDDSDYL